MIFTVIVAMLTGALLLTGLEWAVKKFRRTRDPLWEQTLGRIDRAGTGKVDVHEVKVVPEPHFRMPAYLETVADNIEQVLKGGHAVQVGVNAAGMDNEQVARLAKIVNERRCSGAGTINPDGSMDVKFEDGTSAILPPPPAPAMEAVKITVARNVVAELGLVEQELRERAAYVKKYATGRSDETNYEVAAELVIVANSVRRRIDALEGKE